MSVRRGAVQTNGPFTIPGADPTAGTATSGWFLTAGADFLKCSIWGGAVGTLDVFTVLFSPDGINTTPTLPTNLSIHPAGLTAVHTATLANPSVFYIYPTALGFRTICFLDYIGFTWSADVDAAGVSMSVQPCYIVDAVG